MLLVLRDKTDSATFFRAESIMQKVLRGEQLHIPGSWAETSCLSHIFSLGMNLGICALSFQDFESKMAHLGGDNGKSAEDTEDTGCCIFS